MTKPNPTPPLSTKIKNIRLAKNPPLTGWGKFWYFLGLQVLKKLDNTFIDAYALVYKPNHERGIYCYNCDKISHSFDDFKNLYLPCCHRSAKYGHYKSLDELTENEINEAMDLYGTDKLSCPNCGKFHIWHDN